MGYTDSILRRASEVHRGSIVIAGHTDICPDIGKRQRAGEQRVFATRHAPVLREGGITAVCDHVAGDGRARLIPFPHAELHAFLVPVDPDVLNGEGPVPGSRGRDNAAGGLVRAGDAVFPAVPSLWRPRIGDGEPAIARISLPGDDAGGILPTDYAERRAAGLSLYARVRNGLSR